MRSIKFASAALVILLAGSSIYAAGKNETRRFALVIGANNGGPSREVLKYAHSDAASFMRAITDIGGVEKKDCVVLYDPDGRIMESSVRGMRGSIAAAKKNSRKTEVIFYYSGHSDEEGILLGNERIAYSRLKKEIYSLPADVRIVILDSCSSGAFTQLKGGRMKPAFMTDRAYDMKGNAVMTSSSRSEFSQESERIRGSFFTHFLLTGLRGAADVNQDSRITLNEAYQYAFNHTLRRTENTSGGAQHPNYNIQMSGTGDVILTDITGSATTLVLGDSISGRVAVYNSQHAVIAEVNKPYGRGMTLALPEGKYSAVYDREGAAYETEFTVKSGTTVALNELSFVKSGTEYTAMRGGRDKKNNQSDDHGETLIDPDKMKISGFGGLESTAVMTGGGAVILAGGRGGVLINNWTFGGRGCGLASPNSRSSLSGVDYTGDKPNVMIGFGGFYTEYNFFPKKIFSPSLGMTIGGGSIGFMNMKSDNDTAQSGNAFFAFEPEVKIQIRVTRFFRIGAGLSYLYVSNVRVEEISSRMISGPGCSILFSFGWF